MAGSLKKYGIGKQDFVYPSGDGVGTDELLPTSTFDRLGSMGGTLTMNKVPNLWMTHTASINARYYNSGSLTDGDGTICVFPHLSIVHHIWNPSVDIFLPDGVLSNTGPVSIVS